VTPDATGHAKLKFHPTTQKRSRAVISLSFTSLCVRVEATFSGMRHSPQVECVIMKPFPQHELFMAKLSSRSFAPK